MEFQRPIRVLMLESHPPDVRVMEETLELAGLPAQVTAVSSSDEVLFAAEDATLDIALLNLQLPDVDLTIVDDLRSLDGAKRLPIIAFSTERPEHADHVFPKPEHQSEYMGIVAAIRFYWMSAAPSLPPPPAQSVDAGRKAADVAEEGSIRPQRMAGVDLMSLPIEPVEAYLLSMVDGKMDVDEISLSIGAEIKETRAMLRRLAGLGVVAWRAPHPSMAPPPRPSVTPIIAPVVAPIIAPIGGVGFRRPTKAAHDLVSEERAPRRVPATRLEPTAPAGANAHEAPRTPRLCKGADRAGSEETRACQGESPRRAQGVHRRRPQEDGR